MAKGNKVASQGVLLPGGVLLASDTIDTRNWYAWNNLQPPGPCAFHLRGEVYVPNPGVEVLLVPRNPQGINPSILLLDLILKQQPGNWSQEFVWVPARYDRVRAYYTQVESFRDSKKIADVPVEDIH